MGDTLGLSAPAQWGSSGTLNRWQSHCFMSHGGSPLPLGATSKIKFRFTGIHQHLAGPARLGSRLGYPQRVLPRTPPFCQGGRGEAAVLNTECLRGSTVGKRADEQLRGHYAGGILERGCVPPRSARYGRFCSSPGFSKARSTEGARSLVQAGIDLLHIEPGSPHLRGWLKHDFRRS